MEVTTANALPAGCLPLGLNKSQAAAYCGVGVSLFGELVKAGTMPAPVKVGTKAVWDRRRLAASFDRLQGLSPSYRGADDPDEYDEALADAD